VVHRDMLSIRYLHNVAVVSTLLSLPFLLDSRQNCPAIARRHQVRNWLRSPSAGSSKNTRIRGIEEIVGVPLADNVSRLLCNEAEDIGTNIEAAQGVKTPVGLNSSDFRVVVVVVGISRSNELLGDRVTKEDGKDLVLDGVGLVLVKCDQNKGIVHEFLILEERIQECLEPNTRGGNGSVVAVRGHIGGDEHTLGQLVVLQLLEEHGGVLDVAEAIGLVGDGIEENLRVVLTDIIVGAVLLIDPSETFETCIRHVFLVETPADFLVLE